MPKSKSTEVKRKVQVWVHRSSQSGGEGSHGIEFLVLKTNPARGSFWQPVTGHVESDELQSAAALREASEETGILFLTKPVEVGEPFKFKKEDAEYSEQGFTLEAYAPKSTVTLSSEHVESAWVTAEKARGMLRDESNKKMLDTLVTTLTKGK